MSTTLQNRRMRRLGMSSQESLLLEKIQQELRRIEQEGTRRLLERPEISHGRISGGPAGYPTRSCIGMRLTR